ncbi:MAG: AI-2E family transporter, partial [Clostridia bacterium]|nr:AI-2E family transporter [Clostridia bacterium]
LLVLVSPYDALYFLIIIIILQQLTSNFINPRIIGKTTGLDSVYVILSILVMGGLFGIIGTIIGVPIFVIILKAIRKLIELKSKEENNE